MLAGTGTLTLVLVDLDGFGHINKTSGHATGDLVLRAVAERMRGVVGADGLLGRLGGDEFAAVVRTANPGRLGRDVLEALNTPTAGAPAIGASAGVALIPRDGEDADGLLRAVDVALRVAKRSGRHRVSIYEGESFSDQGPGGARETLERLISGDGLEVVVQPIVTVPAGVPHAFEALARFRTRGSSSPLHWFALADEFGVRERLELACLRAALRTYSSRPPGTSLSINLSGPLLLDHRTHALLEQAGALDELILEMTENSLLEDTPGMHGEISRLLARGIRFAVDDMGAGYSGLRQITTVRPSYLKLDRSLISGIDGDPRARRARLGDARLRAPDRRPPRGRGGRDRRGARRAARSRRQARPGLLSGAPRLAVARGPLGPTRARPAPADPPGLAAPSGPGQPPGRVATPGRGPPLPRKPLLMWRQRATAHRYRHRGIPPVIGSRP